MGAEEYRAASLAQWDQAAPAWEHHAEHFEEGAGGAAAAWMLDAAGLEPGAEVLELACGPAGVGLAAAARVRPGGHVLCTDFAPGMAEAAARRAQAAGAGDVESRVLDAEDMDLPDGSFDAVLCRAGYMLMAEPARAFAETLRVLRPGGRVALGVWAEPEANPWVMAAMGPLMRQLGAPPPDPEAPGIFALADPGRLTGLLERAGFEDIRTERLESTDRHPSPEAWLEYITGISGPVRALLAALGEEDLASVRSAALAEAERYRDGEGVAFPSAIRVAAARRPAA